MIPPPVIGAILQSSKAALDQTLPCGMLIAEIGVLAPPSEYFRVVFVLAESVYSRIGGFGLVGTVLELIRA